MKFLLGTVNTPRVDVGWMQPVSAKDPGDKDKGGGQGTIFCRRALCQKVAARMKISGTYVTTL